MDDREKFYKTSLSEEEDFYSHLNTQDITNADYTHAKKDFEVKCLDEYHDLYVQSDTSFVFDVFNNFWNMCLEIYWLDPALFSLHQD